MLSARGIDDEVKKSYICKNTQNQDVDTSLALNSFDFNEVFYCTAGQVTINFVKLNLRFIKLL
jgi:hypothetical protein